MTKLLRGTTEECLGRFADFSRFNTTDKDMYPIRNAICEMIGVAQVTGSDWFSKKQSPGGLYLLKLQLLLELVGYSLLERDELQPEARKLANQLALGIWTPEGVAKDLGMTIQNVMRIVHGRVGLTSFTIERTQEVTSIASEEEVRLIQEWKEKLSYHHLLLAAPSQPAQIHQPKEIRRQPAPKAHGEHRMVIESLAHLILAAQPLAEMAVSDEFTPSEREQLRQLTETNGLSNGVFELSNLLNRLCGERVRKECAIKS